MVTSASAPAPRRPFCDRPRARAVPAYVIMAISHNVYSRARSARTVRVGPLGGRGLRHPRPGTLRGDVHGIAEQDGARIGGEVGMAVEILGDRSRLGADGVPVVPPVGVKLKMGHVGPVHLQDLHGLEGGGEVARGSKVV